MEIIKIKTPLEEEQITRLKAGNKVLISGEIYTARDAAHHKLVELIEQGLKLPFALKGQVIYYVGPAPAKPGQVIGSAGPTTSGRMDVFTPRLLEAGLKGMIGKGSRSAEVRQSIQKNKAVYMAALGGAGALMSKSIKSAQVLAYPELGTEAIYKLEVDNLPAVVINDIYGNDLYEMGPQVYRLR